MPHIPTPHSGYASITMQCAEGFGRRKRPSSRRWHDPTDPNVTVVDEAVGLPLSNNRVQLRPTACACCSNQGSRSVVERPAANLARASVCRSCVATAAGAAGAQGGGGGLRSVTADLILRVQLEGDEEGGGGGGGRAGAHVAASTVEPRRLRMRRAAGADSWAAGGCAGW